MKRETFSFNTKKEAQAFIKGVAYVDKEQPVLFKIGAPRLSPKTGKHNVTITPYEY